MKYIYILLVLIILLAMSLSSSAQTNEKENTPAAYELMKSKSLWRQSTNAGGLLLDKSIEYTELAVAYNILNGSFHRPQEGRRRNDLVFGAEGAVALEKYYVWGSFDYSRETIKNATYNSSLINPFRDMPYYVADINPSQWNNQHYNLRFKVATPKFSDIVSFGLEGVYQAVNGAKQRDIRSDVRYYNLEVRPAVVFSVNEMHNIGANFDYSNLKEHARMSNVNIYDDQDYYEMYGLGSARRGLGAGILTKHIGNSVGGGLQYYYKGSIDLLLSTNYSKKVEDIQIDGATPRDNATTKDNIWHTKVALVKNGNLYAHILNVGYFQKNIDGIEHVTQLGDTEGWQILRSDIRSKYKMKRAQVDYSLLSTRGEEYSWKTGVEVKYEKKDDKYLIPKSTLNYENILFGINAKKNFVISNQLMKRLLVGVNVGYNKNLSGSYNYNGIYSDYIVVTDFQQTDLNYLISNFYSFGISTIYSQKINSKSDANVFAKAEFKQVRTNDFEFKQRNNIYISFGCNF